MDTFLRLAPHEEGSYACQEQASKKLKTQHSPIEQEVSMAVLPALSPSSLPADLSVQHWSGTPGTPKKKRKREGSGKEDGAAPSPTPEERVGIPGSIHHAVPAYVHFMLTALILET